MPQFFGGRPRQTGGRHFTGMQAFRRHTVRIYDFVTLTLYALLAWRLWGLAENAFGDRVDV